MGQAPYQNFAPPSPLVNFKLLSLFLYFITNDILLKMCTGNPYEYDFYVLNTYIMSTDWLLM